MKLSKIFNSFIAIDFEYLIKGDYTTACQIGMVKCVQDKIVEEYAEIIRPPHTNGPLAPNNSIKIEDTQNALTFSEQYDKIKKFMADLPLVAHNKSTEENVLNKCCELYKLPSLTQGRDWFDTYTDYSHTNLSLSCHKLNIKLDHHHDALCDARACCQLYLLYCKNIPMPYISQEEKDEEKKRKTEKYFRLNCDPADENIIKEITSNKNQYIPTQLDLFANESNENITNKHILFGRKVVITGFEKSEGKRLKERIEKVGGIVIGNVSKNVSYVFLGENPGKKKTEEIAKLIHNGYSIQTILSENIEVILNESKIDTKNSDIESLGRKNLDFTLNHYYEHQMKIVPNGEIFIPSKKGIGVVRKEFFNPFAMKYFYYKEENVKEFIYLSQLIGNLGGCLEREITTDTQVYILSDSTLNKLKCGEKDDTILNIQNSYNKSKAVTFDLTFISLSEVLEFIRLFIDKFQEKSTIELYGKYVSSINRQ